MSTTTLIKNTVIDRYQRQLEREALRRIGVCSTGYRRAAQPFIVECRIDDGQVVIRAGWRQAMQQEQERSALIHLVQRGDDRRSIVIWPDAPHIVAADADGCAIAVCWNRSEWMIVSVTSLIAAIRSIRPWLNYYEHCSKYNCTLCTALESLRHLIILMYARVVPGSIHGSYRIRADQGFKQLHDLCGPLSVTD